MKNFTSNLIVAQKIRNIFFATETGEKNLFEFLFFFRTSACVYAFFYLFMFFPLIYSFCLRRHAVRDGKTTPPLTAPKRVCRSPPFWAGLYVMFVDREFNAKAAGCGSEYRRLSVVCEYPEKHYIDTTANASAIGGWQKT